MALQGVSLERHNSRCFVVNRNLKGVIKSSSTSDIQECWAQAGTQSDQWGKIKDLERLIYWRAISEYLRGKW